MSETYTTLPDHMPVVIVGAGPSGLTAANLLGLAGIAVLLIERNPQLNDFPRAIAIDDDGLRICQAMGISAAISQHIQFDLNVHYLAGTHYLVKVAPTEQKNGYPFVSTFYQPAFETALLHALERFPHVMVRFEHTLDKLEHISPLRRGVIHHTLVPLPKSVFGNVFGSVFGNVFGSVPKRVPKNAPKKVGRDESRPYEDKTLVSLTISTPDGTPHTMTCNYLLACDGGKSFVRHANHIPFESMNLFSLLRSSFATAPQSRALTPEHKHAVASKRVLRTGQRWLVVDSLRTTEEAHEIVFFCNPARPAVTLPAPAGLRRWEFMLMPGEQEQDLLQTATIQRLIAQGWQWLQRPPQATTEQITRATLYTFQTMLAKRFIAMHGHTFLLGDAAHLMPPFGGQGMNSGLRDAHNLCWKISMVLQKRLPATILHSYQQERMPHVARMQLLSTFLGGIIMPTNPLFAALRNLTFRILNLISPIHTMLTQAAIKPPAYIPQGLLMPAHQRTTRRFIGHILPQPFVQTLTGQRVLLDDMLGNTFTLLRLYENPSTAFTDMTHALWQQLDVRFLCVQPMHAHSVFVAADHRSCTTISDSDGILAHFLHHKSDILLFIRPDRFIMGAFHIAETADFVARLERIVRN